MEKWSGVDFGQLEEHVVSQLLRIWLSGGEYMSVRCLGQWRVLLPVQKVVEVTEGFLLGDDGDVVFRSVGHQFARLILSDGSPGGCHQRMSGVLHRVLEVG